MFGRVCTSGGLYKYGMSFCFGVCVPDFHATLTGELCTTHHDRNTAYSSGHIFVVFAFFKPALGAVPRFFTGLARYRILGRDSIQLFRRDGSIGLDCQVCANRSIERRRGANRLGTDTPASFFIVFSNFRRHLAEVSRLDTTPPIELPLSPQPLYKTERQGYQISACFLLHSTRRYLNHRLSQFATTLPPLQPHHGQEKQVPRQQ
jgi:hypothetical protein